MKRRKPWIDAKDDRDEMLRTVRTCRHEQILVSRGTVDEVIGVVREQDLLDQVLDGKALDPLAIIEEPLVVHEGAPFLSVLDQFKKRPVRMAIIVNEYGSLEGIVTPTDLLEAVAGELSSAEEEEPQIVEREDGSLLMDGGMLVADALERLGIHDVPGMRTSWLPMTPSCR